MFRTYVDGVIDVEVGNHDPVHVSVLHESRNLFSWTAGKTGKLTKFEFLIVHGSAMLGYAQEASGLIFKSS